MNIQTWQSSEAEAETRDSASESGGRLRQIDTLSEFLVVWRTLVESVKADFTFGRRLANDPTETLRQYGYEVGPEVRTAISRAIA